MKATIEFDLDDIDDRMSHMACIKAKDMALAFWMMLHNGHTLEQVMEDYNINPDEYTR